MKNILFFGDSNTFASHPLGGRHPWEDRFTGRLQRMLGSEYRVIEEGCGGRTTVFEDEIEPGRNGKTALPVCLTSHNPLDLVVIMLGTNDLKTRFHLTPWDLGRAMDQLIRIVENHPYAPHYRMPKILLVSPIEIGEGIEQSVFGCFTYEAVEKSRRFAEVYRGVAEAHGIEFFDAATVARPSREDQLHMDKASHAALADALCEKILSILG